VGSKPKRHHAAVITAIAARDVDELNRLLAPDGWMLRAREFISGRPVYACGAWKYESGVDLRVSGGA
jgi:hypothetical protein